MSVARRYAGAGGLRRPNFRGAGGRVSGFSPADISDLFFRVNAGLGITTVGGDVGQWADQAAAEGNNDLVQGTDARRPNYVESDAKYGGAPSVTADDTNQEYFETVAFDSAIAQPFTVVLLFHKDSLSAQEAVFDTPNSPRVTIQVNTSGEVRVFAGTAFGSAAGAITAGGVHMVVAEFDGASSRVFVDDMETASGSGDCGANQWSDFRMFRNDGGTIYWGGGLYEMLGYKGTISADDRANLKTYFQAQTGNP